MSLTRIDSAGPHGPDVDDDVLFNALNENVDDDVLVNVLNETRTQSLFFPKASVDDDVLFNVLRDTGEMSNWMSFGFTWIATPAKAEGEGSESVTNWGVKGVPAHFDAKSASESSFPAGRWGVAPVASFDSNGAYESLRQSTKGGEGDGVECIVTGSIDSSAALSGSTTAPEALKMEEPALLSEGFCDGVYYVGRTTNEAYSLRPVSPLSEIFSGDSIEQEPEFPPPMLDAATQRVLKNKFKGDHR
jgi:hypothetical protein